MIIHHCVRMLIVATLYISVDNCYHQCLVSGIALITSYLVPNQLFLLISFALLWVEDPTSDLVLEEIGQQRLV